MADAAERAEKLAAALVLVALAVQVPAIEAVAREAPVVVEGARCADLDGTVVGEAVGGVGWMAVSLPPSQPSCSRRTLEWAWRG